MNPGTFQSQLNVSWRLIKKSGLGDGRNYPDYSALSAAAVRHVPYEGEWRHLLGNRLYDFYLLDGLLAIKSPYRFKPTDIIVAGHQSHLVPGIYPPTGKLIRPCPGTTTRRSKMLMNIKYMH